MGFTRLCLVRPSRLAVPSHDMARKMAVKSLDVLDSTHIYESLAEALLGSEAVYATTSRRGISNILSPRRASLQMNRAVTRSARQCVVFGNEKTGLSREELAAADYVIRIPMAADQPSVNLAQAAQLVAYELFTAALAQRQPA